jgi:hypothetical protein
MQRPKADAAFFYVLFYFFAFNGRGKMRSVIHLPFTTNK